MNAIACKCGSIFAACVTEYIDAEWKLQEAYYKANGCVLIQQEQVRFSPCTCGFLETVTKDFGDLIEEIKSEC